MAEYEILHDEPRYRVDSLVDEILTRTRNVITDMGPRLEALLRDMIGQFHIFRERNYLITFDDVHFAQCRWMQDGALRVDFTIGARVHDENEEFPRHVVIDAFVDDVVRRTVPESLRNEFSLFLRGMVYQFAALKKHVPVALERVSFGHIEWNGDRQLVIAMQYNGERFSPRTVRW